jgi:flavin-dependent dehydrogenase
LRPDDASPLRSIRWLDPGGATLEGTLPGGGGLGVRRTALIEALQARAREEGALLRVGARVLGHRRAGEAMLVRTADPELPELACAVLVAADGLASPRRRAEGLDGPIGAPRRFGVRRHFAIAPWSSSVEVHPDDGVEAYVTPVGDARVGVAFLFDPRVLVRRGAPRTHAGLLARFPALVARLAGAEPASRVLGAGPFARGVRGLSRDRFVLIGDAAGYVDAVTGEGLSLALRAAEALTEVLPDAVLRGGEATSFAGYERAARRAFRKYELVTRGVLALARAPRARPPLLRALTRAPRGVDAVIGWAVG